MPNGIHFSAKSTSTLLILLILLAGLLPGAVQAQRTTPPSEPNVTITPYLLANGDQQPVIAEWVRLTAEENRDTGGSGAVEIPFLRYRTRAAEPGPPIVILTDSPLNGRSPLAMADDLLALTALFGNEADIVVMEPRGVGEARPRLDCPGSFDVALDRPATYERLSRVLGSYYAYCGALWRGAGVDLAGYNARAMAGDVDTMRRALDYDQIRLIGVGFGSQVALTLISEFEESVERAALLLPLGPDQMVTLPSAVQTQLERLDARVQADPVLGEQIPDFLAMAADVLARLAAAPVQVTITDPATGNPVDVTVGELDLQYVTAQLLAQPEQRSLPARYAEMALGDYSWLAERALEWRRDIGGSLMPAVAQCASNASADRLAQIEAEAPTTLLGNAINGVWSETCASIGQIVLDDEFRAAVTSDVPVLLVSGSMDALTPDSNATALLPGLSNSQQLVVDGASHELVQEALPQLAPVLVEFMLGDADSALASGDLSVPFVLEPVSVAAVTEIDDWLGEYYNNRELFGVPVLTRDDPAIDFAWGAEAPAPEVTPDNFSVRWTISRELPADSYRLSVRVNGGVRVWINDVPVLEGWEDSGPRNYVVDLNLGRGSHSARVEYFSAASDAAISVYFTRLQQFPDWKAEFFANPELAGEPSVVRNEETIDYFWGQNPPVPGIPAADWSGRWSRRTGFEGTSYRFTADVAGGVRLWLDGQLLIDSWGDQGPRQLTADTAVLTPGDHDLRVDYFKRSGDGRLRVAWQPLAAAAPPQAVIRGPTRARVNQSIVLDGTDSSAGQGRELVEYSWDWGDGATSLGVQAEHAYGAAGIYNVTLTVTDDAGVSAASSVQLRVDQQPTAPDPGEPPTAVINAPRQGIVGEPVLFDALDSRGENPIISFDWSFGDGTAADAVSVAQTYRAPGTYNVTLVVTDDQGLQSRDNRLILIGAAPATPTPADAPIAPTATPIVPTAVPATPTPLPTQPITDVVPSEPTLPEVPELTPTPLPPTATPATGESPLNSPDQAQPSDQNQSPVGSPPVAVIAATINGQQVNIIRSEERGDVVSIPAEQEVIFSATNSSSGGSPIAENGYLWRVAGQEFNLAQVNMVFPAPGTYEVTLTVTNAAGLSDTALWFVEVPQG